MEPIRLPDPTKYGIHPGIKAEVRPGEGVNNMAFPGGIPPGLVHPMPRNPWNVSESTQPRDMRTGENVNNMAFPGNAPPGLAAPPPDQSINISQPQPKNPWSEPDPEPESKPDIEEVKAGENNTNNLAFPGAEPPKPKLKGKPKNPWHVDSVFDLQYFCCPECPRKIKGKQEFVNHASKSHPWGLDILKEVSDGSLDDIEIPNVSGAHFQITAIKNEPIEDYYYDEPDPEPFYNFSAEMDEDMKEDIDMKEENDEDYEYEPKIKGKSVKKSKSIKVDNPLTKHCNECDMSFKSAYSLKAHKLEVHNDGKAFQCTVCPAKFSISGNLKSHMMIHTGEKNFACTLCEYKCNRNDSLKKHMATHVKDRVKPNKCPQCEKTFFKTFAMKKHIQSVHEGVMPFSCHACEKRFKSKTGLDYHVTLKHDANGRTFDEKTDPEEYKDNPKLAEILRRKAASLKKTSCKLCDAQVFRKQDHVKEAHTDPEGNIKCPKEGCDLKFPSYRLAYYHINGVHNKVPCTLCGEMIGTKHMYTHMQRKHGINPPVKKFNCEFCGKGFAYKLELHDHRNTHTGEKPYLCKFCGKGFASFGTHRMHEKGHLGFKRKK